MQVKASGESNLRKEDMIKQQRPRVSEQTERGSTQRKAEDIKCFKCGKTGHKKEECDSAGTRDFK